MATMCFVFKAYEKYVFIEFFVLCHSLCFLMIFADPEI